MQNAYQPPYMI